MIDWIIDARDHSHPIADQGQRPTCLAVATTGAHEHAIRSPASSACLSAEYLHWASEIHGGRGLPAAVASALQAVGQPPADQWPYLDTTDDADPGYAPPPEVVGPFAYRGSVSQLPDFDGLVAVLQDGRWPVLGLRVTDAFAARGSAIVLPDGPGRARHAVLLVGAAHVRGNGLGPHVRDGERLMCVRNSWGAGWGQRGHKLVTEAAIAQTLEMALVLDTR